MTGWGKEPSKLQVRFLLFPASQGPAISPSLAHRPGSAFLFPTPRKAKLSCSARLVSSERRHLLSTCGALGIFPGKRAASLPLLPLPTLHCTRRPAPIGWAVVSGALQLSASTQIHVRPCV